MIEKPRKIYQRMYETRSVRPYYTIPHLGIFGTPFKKLIGFEYKDIIYITSAKMNNSAYFEKNEMERASKYFSKIWSDSYKSKFIIQKIRRFFKDATKIEKWAWKQNWSQETNKKLIRAIERIYKSLFCVATAHIVSQPQHIVYLEQKITKLLEPFSNKDMLLCATTYFLGDLPQTSEEKEIKEFHIKWRKFTKKQKDEALKKLTKKYGWINEVEGNIPYDKEHYRQKILNFKEKKKLKIGSLKTPKDIHRIGQLIGGLGFLRFWSRYHLLHLRYHLKYILKELIERSGNSCLEFATVEEIVDFLENKKVNIAEIKRRKNGYASFLKDGHTVIVAGAKAQKLKKIVKEAFANMDDIEGMIANKGKAIGRVRVISFIAKDYNQQVSSFKKGEILITGMTRPQIVHLCIKAAAIVTDEGGITSHAAVVSREFNIPCIIGTHNATKVLKTGDLVEVDANKGVVRVLNNE